MAEAPESQIRKALCAYANRNISLDEFRDSFVPISWDIENSGDPDAISLAHQIDGILAEASSSDWTEEELRQELSRPFAALQFAENCYGDAISSPDHPPIAESNAGQNPFNRAAGNRVKRD